jgi:oxygen-independent coproporphyrinogen-3 oxidase
MFRSRALYLHVPWSAGEPPSEEEAARFARAVAAEAALLREDPLVRETRVLCLAVGGSDPLSLHAEALREVLHALGSALPFHPDAQRTCEGDARSVSPAKLAVLREAGFGRLCVIGAPGPDQAIPALHAAARAGFTDVALDAPIGAAADDLLEDPRIRATTLSHVSLVEPGGESLGEGAWIDAYGRHAALLARRGFERYEISHFARPGRRSRHLQLIHGGGDTVGIGPGALTSVGGVRRRNEPDPEAYAEILFSGRSPAAEDERLTPEEIARERVFLGIRRAGGVDLRALGRLLGLDLWERAEDVVAGLERGGFVRGAGPRLVLTERGIRVADSVASEILG